MALNIYNTLISGPALLNKNIFLFQLIQLEYSLDEIFQHMLYSAYQVVETTFKEKESFAAVLTMLRMTHKCMNFIFKSFRNDAGYVGEF